MDAGTRLAKNTKWREMPGSFNYIRHEVGLKEAIKYIYHIAFLKIVE